MNINTENVIKKKEYHKMMIKTYLNMFFIAAQSFDKTILTLSVAALGFISGFIHITHQEYSYICFAVLALLFFIVTAGIILINFIFLEEYALGKFEDHLNILYQNNKDWMPDNTKAGKYLRIFQWIAFSSFVLGIIMFFMFFICNSI